MTTRVPDARHYDNLYGSAYMSGFTDVYEYCRYRTLAAVLPALARRFRPRSILDVGCGQGRYLSLLRAQFPDAEFLGVDFSEVAIEKARRNHPGIRFQVGSAEELSLVPDASVDLLVNVEVMEHVADARRVAAEFARVLRRNGRLLLTTPCANRFSLEWLENRVAGRIRRSVDGYRLFGTDPPEHVRRFTEPELTELLGTVGFRREWVRFRGHLFTQPCYLAHRLIKRFLPIFGQLAYLDWRLFRTLPNGSTMLGLWVRGPRVVPDPG
jgi:ubiquinone/menaquinone biosynthesis C-methylase UbiE